MAYNGDVPEDVDDLKIDNYEVGSTGDKDFLEKLRPKLTDMVRKYSESNFDLFQPFFQNSQNLDFEVQKEIHTKLLAQSAFSKIQDLCSKHQVTNSKELFDLIDLEQYLQDNLLSRTLLQYEELILQRVIEWRHLLEQVHTTSQSGMTNSDIARIK